MSNTFTKIALVTCAAFALAGPVQATAGDQPNILIVGEDADRDTIPRNSRVFNRVLRAISERVQLKGFRVYDETAVTMNITNPGRVRRTDAELITVAKRVQNVPIDVITVFQIYASAEKNPYADVIDLRIRIPGRLLHVQTGQALGNYEISYNPGDLPPLPVNCNSECVLEHLGAQTKRIAADVGEVLATRLDAISPARPTTSGGAVVGTTGGASTVITTTSGCTGLTTAFTLIFRGFSSSEITMVEEYIVAFKGYDHHRPVRSGATEAQYWYESCTDTARLNRNLRLMVEQMGLQARIGLVGQRIEVDQIGVPKKR